MKSLKDYIYECLEISESQKTWQTEIIDIAKQFIIEPNYTDFERKDIEKMIQTKKIDFSLIAYLSEYLGYIVTNKYGDLDFDELVDKFKSKTRKEAYLKLHDYDEGSNDPEDKEITELIITGLKKGLAKNKDF